MNKLLITLIAFFAITAVSCSNDDEPQMPANAISLNMMNGDSETTIGGSDVYINTSNNFTSLFCGIANLGKKGGFSLNPNLTQIAQEVAVTPGNFYQITLANDIRTVAGARALPINTNYYNVYVDSWIYDKDNNISGAKISYAECYPQSKLLSEWDTVINVKLKSQDEEYLETATYPFSKGCEIDKNFNIYSLDGNTALSDNLELEIKGNQIKFSNTSYAPNCKARVEMLVRHESIYTRVIFDVESYLGS